MRFQDGHFLLEREDFEKNQYGLQEDAGRGNQGQNTIYQKIIYDAGARRLPDAADGKLLI